MKLKKQLIAVCMLSTAFADEALSKNITEERPPVAPQYDNRFGFSFDRLVYERIKNDSFYYGVDLWADLFWTSHIKHHFVYSGSYYKSEKHVEDDGFCGRGEVRFGYNFFYNGRDHLTPNVNGGYLRTLNSGNKFIDFAYGGLGLKYSHEFNSVFGCGVKLNSLFGQLRNHYIVKEEYVTGYESVYWYSDYNYTLREGYKVSPVYRDSPVWKRSHSKRVDKAFAWGIDLSLLAIFRWGHYRHWDVTMEPAICYIHSNKACLLTLGGRATVGYRF